MGTKATVTYDWLKTAKLTPIQLLYVFIAIFAFIFMATDIFKSLPGIVQSLFYGSIVVVGVLLGVSVVNIKKLALEMKAIYIDANMTPEQKVNAYGNLALQVLMKLGQAFDLLNETQFDNLKVDDEKIILENKIAELQEKIDSSP